MEELIRNWRAIRSIAGDEGRLFLEYARRFYLVAFAVLVSAAVITIGLMVGANFIKVKGLCFWLVIPFLIVWAFCQFYPAVLLSLFGIGSIDGLPKGWSLNRLIKERELPDLSLSAMVTSGLELIHKIVMWGAQVALFVVILGVVLGTWDLENPKVVVPVLVILTGIGLWTAIYPTTSHWYRRIAISILLIAVAFQLWDGYVSIPTQKKAASASTEILPTIKDVISGLVGMVSRVTLSPSTASPAPSTQACQGPVVLETVYTPSESKGPAVLATLAPGKYGVTTSGLREQLFYTRDLSRTYTVQMDPDGRQVKKDNSVWRAGNINPETPQPVVGEAYGAFVIRADKPYLLGSSGTFTLDQETQVKGDVNIFSHPDAYVGPGSLKVVLVRCG